MEIDYRALGLHPELDEVFDQLDEPVRIACVVAWLCQCGADPRWKREYAKTWWSEFFPQRIAVSAMTSSSLSEFTATLAGRLRGQIGGTNDAGGESQRMEWTRLLAKIEVETERRVLDSMERQSIVCATICRTNQDLIRAESPPKKSTVPQGVRIGE